MIEKFCLLIVDDDKQNRLLLSELLQDDHRVILAKNGLQALDRAREHQPDLILLDVLMPEMDGYAVIRALKHDDATRHIPVIFVSALDSAISEELGLELGAVDYIAKPFNPSIVRARVRNHLQLVHQRRLLERLAMIDSLTEIPNRRRFMQHLEQERRRCLRSDSPLSLMVLDVDHFKNFNDTYGHIAGDVVLKQVATAIKGELKRPGDMVARYGGEEFVVLMPEIDAGGAYSLAGQIRAAVEALNIPHADSTAGPRVTLSIGGITVSPDELGVDDALIERADKSLYEAKHSGRNRVVWARASDAT